MVVLYANYKITQTDRVSGVKGLTEDLDHRVIRARRELVSQRALPYRAPTGGAARRVWSGREGGSDEAGQYPCVPICRAQLSVPSDKQLKYQ
ncbi:hypothetical protein J6590_080150 [Homalodisca vitripennis]|nr:hypothetical protein J6590_080150 [Homalodisca vitripennis]